MMFSIDAFLYKVSSVFLLPSLALILLALVYALYSLGSLISEALLRRKGQRRSGLSRYAREAGITSDDLELWILKRLEMLRLASRVSPLLGLVATLIPMGPALLALTENDASTVGENMVVAFAGVTLALIAASLTFAVLNIRRRWLLEELRLIEREKEGAE